MSWIRQRTNCLLSAVENISVCDRGREEKRLKWMRHTEETKKSQTWKQKGEEPWVSSGSKNGRVGDGGISSVAAWIS